MKKLFIFEKIKQFTSQELALYIAVVGIFLPFYLYIPLFLSYFIFLMTTNKLKGLLRSLRKHPIMIVFLLYSLCVSLLSRNVVGAIITIFFFLFMVFFYYYQRKITPDLFHIIIQTMIIFSLFSVAFACLEHYGIVEKVNYAFISPDIQRVHQNRAETTFFNPNYYGIACCFFVIMSCYFFNVTKNWKWKLLSIASCVINAFALNLSQSRTAFPAIVCALIIYLFTTIKNSHAFWFSILGFAFAMWLLFSSDLGLRMGSIDAAFDDRVLIWRHALHMFDYNRWYGSGPLTYMHLYATYHAPFHEHAHSLYIDTILSYGYLGTAILITTFFLPIRQLVLLSQDPGKRPVVGLILGFLTVVAVHGVFDLAVFWLQSGFIFLVVFTTIPMWLRQPDTVQYPEFAV